MRVTEPRPLTVRSNDGTVEQVSPGGTFRIYSAIPLDGVVHYVRSAVTWDGQSLDLGEVAITRESIPLRELWRMIYETLGIRFGSSAQSRGGAHG